MKKLFLLALLAMIMVGCDTKHSDGTYEPCRYKVYVIDSCEYVGVCEGSQYDFLAHKGNCRFCLERNKKMIKEQIDSALIQKFD